MTKIKCEVCGTEASAGMYKRWHGERCKKSVDKLENFEDFFIPQGDIVETKGEEVMSMFVEVQSVTKGCSVIINLEHVIEIAPLNAGGTALFINDPNVPGGRSEYKVEDSYDLFKQFALQTVSADDIAKKIAKLKGG